MSPKRAPRPCSVPACPALVVGGGRCDRHARQADEDRGLAHERGYDAKWRKTRARYLRRLEAEGRLACENCAGTPDVVGPLHVDHLDGLGPHGPRGHDLDNLQALCASCHGIKTAHQTNIGGAHE